MALTDSDHAFFPAYHPTLSLSSDFTFDAIDINSDLLAGVFQIPKTGTIDKVHYRTGTAVSSPVMTHRIELRTVDATTGLPNGAGTLYGGSTSIAVDASTYAANTNYTAAVNATGATKGDIAAVVFDLSAFTSGSFTQVRRVSDWLGTTIGGKANAFPYGVNGSSPAAPVKNSSGQPPQCWALEYSGGLFVPVTGVYGYVGSRASTTLQSTGTVRGGNYFVPATPRRAIGIYCDLPAFSGAAKLSLRTVSGDTEVATCTLDKDVIGTTTAILYALFDGGATYTLAAGTAYYVVAEATDASGIQLSYLGSGVSLAMLDICSGKQNCYGVTYASGSYTSYTSANAVRRYGIGLITDQEDNGAGGSGTTIAGTPLMRGMVS